jgi:methyltransferase
MEGMTMASTLVWYWALLVGIGTVRLCELVLSRRHQRALAAQGVGRAPEPHFRAMVVLHTAVLVGAGVEATLASWSGRSPVAAVSVAALVVVAAAIALRIWVIVTLGPHWNVQIMDSMPLGVVSDGPFRWIRHPNYVAVFLELLALPAVHGAWITASLGTLAHLWVLYHRIGAEEAVLLAHPAYQRAMGDKPRFVPRLRAGAERRRPDQDRSPA